MTYTVRHENGFTAPRLYLDRIEALQARVWDRDHRPGLPERSPPARGGRQELLGRLRQRGVRVVEGLGRGVLALRRVRRVLLDSLLPWPVEPFS